jgi:hypothetical protein
MVATNLAEEIDFRQIDDFVAAPVKYLFLRDEHSIDGPRLPF